MSDIAIYNITQGYFEEDGQQWAAQVYTKLEEWTGLTLSAGKDAYDENHQSTSIGEVTMDNAADTSDVTVYGNTIYINGNYKHARIFDTTGRTIVANTGNATTVTSGIYVVIVDGHAIKVMVR